MPKQFGWRYLALALLLGGCSGRGVEEASGRGATQDPPAKASAAVLLSAAFGEFARDGGAYAALHRRYLGVTQGAPVSAEYPAWPAGEVGENVIRLGFVPEVPLHMVDAAGRHSGFEADLAAELVRRINEHYARSRVMLEWVPVDVVLPVGPSKNFLLFNVLARGLRLGRYEVAFSCVVPVEAADIAYLSPTMTMFPGIVYTGRDNLDVSGIHARPSLVAFLAAHPGMTFVHGMGTEVYVQLEADVKKAGGAISLAGPGALPHFRMADILGISKMNTGPGGVEKVLDVNPRTDVQLKAPFTLSRVPR